MPQKTSIVDERVRPFQLLKKMSLHPNSVPFVVAEGPKVVERLLRSPISILSILCTEQQYREFAPSIKQKGIADHNILIAEQKELEQIVGFRYHQGIMALIPHLPSLPLQELSPPYVILNQISNPENVGAITRTARAFGISSLITDSGTCSPYLRRSIRVSMGTCFDIRWHHSEDLSATLSQLKNSGTTLFGCEITPESTLLPTVRFPENSAFIFGSEGYGIQEDILQNCDQIISIPHASPSISLNVATACGVVLYEYRSQWPYQMEEA